MRILALDLATNTGWATSHPLAVGTWRLATPKEVKTWTSQRLNRRRDPRILRLADILSKYCGHVDAIVTEDVTFSSSTYQTQLWASLRAAVWLACRECDILFETVPVTTLKKWATGHGNATKDMMIESAQKAFSIELDDNMADAYHILQWAEQNLSRMKTI